MRLIASSSDVRASISYTSSSVFAFLWKDPFGKFGGHVNCHDLGSSDLYSMVCVATGLTSVEVEAPPPPNDVSCS